MILLSYFFYGLVYWLVIFILIIFSIHFKNKFLIQIGELTAHQLITIVICGNIFFITYFFLKTSHITKEYLWSIGIMWLLLTIIFETLIKYSILKYSWKKILLEYNILNGRLWILVLISLLSAPYIVFMIQ